MCWRFGFLPVSIVLEGAGSENHPENLLVCIFGGPFLHALPFWAAPAGVQGDRDRNEDGGVRRLSECEPGR